MSAPPATDTCPRCGTAFHCGARDAAPCACTRMRLDAATLAGLRQRYRGCLCLACLVQLAASGAATGGDNDRMARGSA